jgi:hypothetical protein
MLLLKSERQIPLQGLRKIIKISNIMQFIQLDIKLCGNISQPSADIHKKVKCITEERKIGSRFDKTL